MKGVVYNLLEEAVTQDYGENVWDSLLDRAGLSGSYTSLGNYPDEDLRALVQAAAERLSLSPSEVLRWAGRRMLPLLARRYPLFLAQHANTRSFVLSLNKIIHPEVRKIYPGANTPEFEFDTSNPDRLRMRYRSPRRLCALAEGMIQAAAEAYHEAVELEHPRCLLRGDEACEFEMRFRPARVPAE